LAAVGEKEAEAAYESTPENGAKRVARAPQVKMDKFGNSDPRQWGYL
jgi:hypothetical protein